MIDKFDYATLVTHLGAKNKGMRDILLLVI